MSVTSAVGIDVGGTKLVGGAIDAVGTVHARARRTTPGDGDALMAILDEMVAELDPDGTAPVGVAIAGLVDRDGVFRYGPNVAARDLAVADRLAATLARPIVVVNDASAATVAEQRIGAAAGLDDVVMFTLGTGVGGGVIAHGRLVEGHHGMGGELGHLIVEDGGRRCPCGTAGCLEAYASGRAIEAAARARFEGGAAEIVTPATPLTGRAVVAAAQAGVADAIAVLEEAGRWLGVAIASMVSALDPGMVVVGGGAGVATAPWVLPAARASADERLFGRGWREPVRVEPAALGDDAGMIGAALLAFDPNGAGVHR
jgi:glucokinase